MFGGLAVHQAGTQLHQRRRLVVPDKKHRAEKRREQTLIRGVRGVREG